MPSAISKLIVAHRGGAVSAPENTLDAFAEAIAVGADMVEFDVRRTADDQLVACHDPLVQGTPIAAMTLCELRERLATARPATLDEILALTAGRIAVDVELKEAGYERAAVDEVRRHGAHGPSSLVTSFVDEVLVRVRRAAPTQRIGLIVDVGDAERPIDVLPPRRVAALAPTCVMPSVRLVEHGFLDHAASIGVTCFPWTVNDPTLLDEILRHPAVAGVITDVPGLALEVRARVDGSGGTGAAAHRARGASRGQ